jgi:hypothetical protein
MTSHERQEGFLDYGSGRYKLIGRAGRDDHSLHAGEWLEVRIGTGWLSRCKLTYGGGGTSWMRMDRGWRCRWACVPG